MLETVYSLYACYVASPLPAVGLASAVHSVIIMRIYIIIIIIITVCIVNFYAHPWVVGACIQNDIILLLLLLYDVDRRKLARARVERRKKQQSADNDWNKNITSLYA